MLHKHPQKAMQIGCVNTNLILTLQLVELGKFIFLVNVYLHCVAWNWTIHVI